jgi:hypothetical protein
MSERIAGKLDPALVERLRRALTVSGDELFTVMQDGSPEVLRAALRNPGLGEDHLLALLKRRDLAEDLLKAIHQHKSAGSSHRLKVALAYNPMTPGPIIQSLLGQLFLFELITLCYLPGVTPDQKLAAERIILQRLPTTDLGNKVTLARRGTSILVGELLKEGEPRLFEACLSNPRLKEISILQFLNGPRGTAETISIIARHPRWKTRPNLKMAILKNRMTPPVWFTLFLPPLRPAELNELLASRRLSPAQKKLAEDERKRRGF